MAPISISTRMINSMVPKVTGFSSDIVSEWIRFAGAEAAEAAEATSEAPAGATRR